VRRGLLAAEHQERTAGRPGGLRRAVAKGVGRGIAHEDGQKLRARDNQAALGLVNHLAGIGVLGRRGGQGTGRDQGIDGALRRKAEGQRHPGGPRRDRRGADQVQERQEVLVRRAVEALDHELREAPEDPDQRLPGIGGAVAPRPPFAQLRGQQLSLSDDAVVAPLVDVRRLHRYSR
jgi:hypothetical protein